MIYAYYVCLLIQQLMIISVVSFIFRQHQRLLPSRLLLCTQTKAVNPAPLNWFAAIGPCPPSNDHHDHHDHHDDDDNDEDDT